MKMKGMKVKGSNLYDGVNDGVKPALGCVQMNCCRDP